MAKTINSHYEMVGINQLRPHPQNPRKGDVGAIYESIEANGFYGAIVAQKSTGHILAGNHRWKAAHEANLASIPVIWVECDDDRALRILLADNRANDKAGYDDSVLADILAKLSNESDLIGTGYTAADLDDLIGSVAELDGMPELPSGDREPIQQMTFTLHDNQAEIIKEAIEKAKAIGPFPETGNENSNGNALARVAELFLSWGGNHGFS